MEYANQGGQIQVVAGNTPDGTLYVKIANTGCRLDAAERGKAFEPFWRADGSRSSDGRHVGLGLSLVRRFARALGGDASPDVEEDGMFCVHLTLGGPSTP